MTFFFTTLFMVLVFWRPQEWLVPQMYGYPVLDVVFYMSILSLVMEVDQGKMRFDWNAPILLLLSGLFVAVIMSHAAHTYFGGILDAIPVVGKLCMFTLLLFCVLDKPHRFRIVAILFVVMSCVMAKHALLQAERGFGFAFAPPLWVPQIGGKPPHTRSMFFGIFGDPNDLAQILATSIPLIFMIPKKRSFFWFLIGGMIVWYLFQALLATHSRGGLVAVTASAAVVLILLLPARWLPFAIGVSTLAALSLCTVAGPYMDESAHDRVVFWGLANEMFKQNLVFGIGFDMFWQVTGDSRAAHNAFVLCYTELGLFGYWFWFTMILTGILGVWRARMALENVDDPEARWIKRMSGLAIAAVVGYCASSYFLSRSFVYPLFFLFALMAAVPVLTHKYLPTDHPPLIRLKQDVFLLGTAGTVASILYVYFSIVLLNKAFYGDSFSTMSGGAYG